MQAGNFYAAEKQMPAFATQAKSKAGQKAEIL